MMEDPTPNTARVSAHSQVRLPRRQHGWNSRTFRGNDAVSPSLAGEAHHGLRVLLLPEIQGRGGFVRLALEDAGTAYIHVARGLESEGRGVPAMLALMRGEGTSHIPFARPFLRDGDMIVSHTAAISLYLGGRIELAPTDEDGRLWTHQIQLTITDMVKEKYNSHHPIDEDKWVHQQKDAAITRAAVFLRDRMPKFLGWFERILEANPEGGDRPFGSSVTYADLSLFQLIEGFRFAFPLAPERELANLPRMGRK
jgi:glutathione S-transferase